MTDVFISYKREERERCIRIAEKLRALGLDVWFDAKLESGTSFDTEIEHKIHAAKAVLVIWSPLSVKSAWIRNEATIGQKRDVLVCIQIAPCTVPINFTNTHMEFLHDPDFPDADPSWLAIVRRIAKLTQQPHLAVYVDALAGAATRKPRAPLAPMLAAVALGAIFGAAGGYFGADAIRATAAFGVAAAATPAAPSTPTPADLIGVWGGGDFQCESLPLRLSLEAEGLGLAVGSGATQRERLTSPADLDGWFSSENAGADNYWRRDGEALLWRIGSSADAATETRLLPCAS